MVYLDQIFILMHVQHSLITGMCKSLFMDEDLLSISLAGYGQLVKMLITLEPHGIFG